VSVLDKGQLNTFRDWKWFGPRSKNFLKIIFCNVAVSRPRLSKFNRNDSTQAQLDLARVAVFERTMNKYTVVQKEFLWSLVIDYQRNYILCHSHFMVIYLRQRRRYMFSPVFICLSVCLWARLLKKACIDLDEMLRVDRCRDMDELINFWARSGL